MALFRLSAGNPGFAAWLDSGVYFRVYPGDNIRVFAVWEPMLPTDWTRPNTRVLARLLDPRVIQDWDKDHLLSGLMEKGAPVVTHHVAP